MIHVCVMTFAIINVKRTATEWEPRPSHRTGTLRDGDAGGSDLTFLLMDGNAGSWHQLDLSHSGGKTRPPRCTHGRLCLGRA